jgi:hypothetical protein
VCGDIVAFSAMHGRGCGAARRGVEDHLGAKRRVQDAASTTEGAMSLGFDFSLVEGWNLARCDVMFVCWSWWVSEVGLGGVLQLSGGLWWTLAAGGGVSASSLPRRVRLWSVAVGIGGGLQRLVGWSR